MPCASQFLFPSAVRLQAISLRQLKDRWRIDTDISFIKSLIHMRHKKRYKYLRAALFVATRRPSLSQPSLVLLDLVPKAATWRLLERTEITQQAVNLSLTLHRSNDNAERNSSDQGRWNDFLISKTRRGEHTNVYIGI